VTAWAMLDLDQRLLFNKMLTGELRIGVSQRTVQNVLVEMSDVDIARIAQRMIGTWTPSAAFLAKLLSSQDSPADRAQPYPFYLASPLESPPESLGPTADWLLEWKWDGIRLQLLKRDGEIALWSRGEERLDGRFPEIEAAATHLPDGVVLDGELLAWSVDAVRDAPQPFAALQKRIQRRKPGSKMLQECPVVVQCYDLLEFQGQDWRLRPLKHRREQLESVLEHCASPLLRMSPAVAADDWVTAHQLRGESRSRNAEGLMLKRLDSPYRHGRPRGDWWKWKIDPLTIDAVLIYAQSGHGRRSNLYTDYTFGLWDDNKLVPVAKAYSGLDDREIAELDKWIRANTLNRFGPVRAVAPHHVFELGFEAVNRSTRHKSGTAVRFPRILRWRHDKTSEDADTLDALRALAQ
jgi:DNA ligase-1